MFATEWHSSNAYRILGLRVDAGPSEMHAAASALRRAAALGLDRPLDADLPELGIVQRNEAILRAAVGRMENSEQRLQDRLFWFNCTLTSVGADWLTPSDAAVAHDDALKSLLAAGRAGNEDIAPGLWTQALRQWHAVVSRENYWNEFHQFEFQSDFEPAALPSELDALRARAVSIAGAPLVSLARQAQEGGDIALAGRIVASLGELADTGGWASAAVDDLIEPRLASILALCENVKAELDASLKREPDAAARNVAPCASALARFRKEVCPSLEALRVIAPRDSDGLLRTRDATARCLASIASATTWTDDFVKADELYREALILGEGTVAIFEIEQNLESIQKAARFQRTEIKPSRHGSSGAHAETQASAEHGEAPTVAAFIDLCDEVQLQLEKKILREAGAALQNAAPCSTALKRFRNEINPTLDRLLAIAAEKSDAHFRVREAAARCLAGIASATTWTDDFVYAEKLYSDALALADGTAAKAMISHALKEIAEAARLQRLRGKPISAAPPLYTFNGIGLTLYGHADSDVQTGSYVATLYFVIFMVPVVPVSRYRVIAHPGGRFQFLGKQPFRTIDRWWLGLVAGAVAGFFLWATIQSHDQGGSPIADSSVPSVDVVTPDANAAAPAAADAAAAVASNPAPDAADTPTSPLEAAGASAPAVSQEAGLKSLIEAGRSRMSAIDDRLTALKAEIEPLSGSMDALKAEIDGLDARRSAGEEIDSGEYNARVDAFNAKITQMKSLKDEYNDLVGEYNRLLSEDRSMVARYNSGER